MLRRPLNFLRLTRVLMFILLGAVYYNLSKGGNLWQQIFVISSTILLLGNHILLFSTQLAAYQTRFIFIDFLISACYGLFFAGQSNLYLIFFGIFATTLFLMTDNRKTLYTYILLFFLFWLFNLYVIYIKTNRFDYPGNLVNFMFIFYGAVVGRLIRNLLEARRKEADQYELLSKFYQELSDVYEQLRSYSKQVEELTVIRERNQIAREIHDTVGHKMTALIVQLQLARDFIPIDLNKSKDTIHCCEKLAREALGEIRTSVKTLQEDDSLHPTFLSSIQNLLKEFSQMTIMDITLDINGDPANTPTTLQPVIIRVIQESLTNSKRHGNASRCKLSLHFLNDSIRLSVQDNGMGITQLNPGFGLSNMRTRVMEHGGSIQYESTKDGGFGVMAEFPLKQFQWGIRGKK